jgi:acetyl-CoA carboxylase carboxyl transferase subunit beta
VTKPQKSSPGTFLSLRRQDCLSLVKGDEKEKNVALENLFSIVKERWKNPSASDKTAKKEPTPAENTEPKAKSEPTEIFKCPRCMQTTAFEAFEKNLKVCPACNYHGRMTARERLAIFADKGTFSEFDSGMTSANPIEFPGYTEKMEALRAKTGLVDAIITGTASIHGIPFVIGVMDSNFMMASMGSVVGEKITRAFEYAEKSGLPLVMFTASGGARMQEGIISLMQMAKTSAAAARFSESGGLFISILTDPTTGGVEASFASLGDIIIAEPKVLIGFAGRRVIEGTIKQRLPDDFQSAEFQLEHGFVDLITERKSMRKTIRHILRLHGYRANGGVENV